ncbi:hypothetical protein BGZ60DRAFT_533409 [Tricladium varicosporioides]|nr:hypothetical protein BGZ60DRAFT_533409 [Hymenoscyphus varicosporioides]
MKAIDVLVYWICLTSLAIAQAPPITPCGLSCIVQTLPASNCAITNTTCQCTSRTLADDTAACMLANCSMGDTLVLSRFQANTCNSPYEDRSGLVVSIFIVVPALVAVLVISRLFSKLLGGVESGWEDWVIGLALVLVVPSIIFTFEMTSQGFGKHLYSLNEGDLLKILRSFYIAENIYVVALSVTKLSILCFYMRIFQHQALFRTGVWTTIAFIVLSTTIISILTIFQCRPITYFWNRDIKGGVCLDVNALAYANSALSMVQDVVIVFLPIPVVWKINLDSRKKFGIGIMFALGGFGCIVSGIRLRSLLVFGNSIDPSWDYVPVVVWTALEIGVAMICSCLPALRTLLIRTYPHSLISKIRSRENNSGDSASRFKRNILGKPKNLLDLSDDDVGMTNITWNGKDFEYPRKPPMLPPKDTC